MQGNEEINTAHLVQPKSRPLCAAKAQAETNNGIFNTSIDAVSLANAIKVSSKINVRIDTVQSR
jgi:hypothetical protein